MKYTLKNLNDRKLNIEKTMIGLSKTIRNRLDDMENSLLAGHHVNAHGVIQSTGAELDRCAAIRELLAESINMIQSETKGAK